MGWGGLRGAVGIALALTLHAETEHFSSATVHEHTVDDEAISNSQYTDYTSKLFGMVGGMCPEISYLSHSIAHSCNESVFCFLRYSIAHSSNKWNP